MDGLQHASKVSAGDPTSSPKIQTDNPTKTTAYPGKVLNHRYEPGERTKQIVEEANQHGRHLASEVNFVPVTTLNLPNKNIYVRPVKNVKPRYISPIPLAGPLTLPIRGERVFDISTDFQRQLEKRLGQIMGPYEQKPRPPDQTGPTQQVREQQPAFITEPKIPNQEPPPAKVLTQQIQKESEPSAEPTPQGIQTEVQTVKTSSVPIPKPPAEKIETIKTPAEVPIPALPPSNVPTPTQFKPLTQPATTQQRLAEDLNKLTAQLNQESTQKDVGQARIVELTNKYQSQIASLVQEKSTLNTQMKYLKNKLDEEIRNRATVENRLTTVTNQLNTEMNRMKIERDALLGRLRDAQVKAALSQDVQSKAASAQAEIAQLSAKLSQVEKEKDDIEAKTIKFENLLKEFGRARPAPQEVREVIVPQLVTEKEGRVPVKIIQPTRAIGKMAPALTTIPNVVNGIIKDVNGMLLTEVVIVVKDGVGNPVRALKSNKIGQFAISTPLPSGTYTMELEKEGNEFDVVQIKLEGKVLSPIEIRSR